MTDLLPGIALGIIGGLLFSATVYVTFYLAGAGWRAGRDTSVEIHIHHECEEALDD